MLLPQRQKAVLIVQLPQQSAHLGPCTVAVLGQLTQTDLPPGDSLLQLPEPIFPLLQLFRLLGTALLLLFQVGTLGGQVIVPHGRPLGLGLGQPGA